MFEIGTFIFSIVMFLIMFLIVWRFGFRPIANMLEQRRVHIETQILDAEKGRQEAAQVLKSQQKMLDDARNEVKAMLDAARTRADEQGRKLLADANVEAERILAEGRALIERERAEAMTGVLAKVAELTCELTTKLLQTHVSAETNAALLADAEKRLGELVW